MGGRGNYDPIQHEMRKKEIADGNRNILINGQDSYTAHTRNGQYVSSRADLHKKILNKLARESNSHRTPTLTVLLGLDNVKKGGSSSLYNKEKEYRNFKKDTFISTSKIMQSLPEYKQMKKLGYSNEKINKLLSKETKDLYNKAIKLVGRGKRSATVDFKTFKDVSSGNKVLNSFKNKGYNIRLVYNESTNAGASKHNSVIKGIYDGLKSSSTSYAMYKCGKRIENYAPAYTRVNGRSAKKKTNTSFNKTIATDRHKMLQKKSDKIYGNKKTKGKKMNKDSFMERYFNELKRKNK